MRRSILCFVFSVWVGYVYPQMFGKAEDPVKYKASEVLDSVYGIVMYDRMNPQIGGDSSRSNQKGYAVQGWEEDYYENGKLLHKGYYEDGQLRSYKNYYDNGELERSFKVIDFRRCSMEIYYPDGKKKSEIVYSNGDIQKATDYYDNGQIEYEMEYEKHMEFILFRRSYTRDGSPLEIFECKNTKKKVFYQKEYYQNGKLRTEGNLKYNFYKFDYMKDGTWKVYDENGKFMRNEKYAYGERLKD